MYKVTIAMPVYNVANYVEQSLLSALNQTFESIEFLIIDDKGTDNSIEIVKKIQQSHPRGRDIRIIDHIINQGTGATKNSAMKEARGEYLYFMDSDDTILPKTIELLYNKIKETNADVVAASYQIVSEKRIRKMTLPNMFIETPMALCKWMEDTKLYFNLYTWNKLYNIQFLRNHHVYCVPNHRNEDALFTFEVVLYAASIVTMDTITYNYYMRPGSVVHQKINDFYYNQFIEILQERIKCLNKIKINYPCPIYNYLLEPFFEYYIRQVLISDFDEEKKNIFIKEMQQIYELDFTEKYLYGRRYKKIYRLLKTGDKRKLVSFYQRDLIIAKYYRKFMRILPFLKPYNHL